MIRFFQALVSVLVWIGIGFWTLCWTVLIFLVYINQRWLDPQHQRMHRMAAAWGRMLVAMAPGCSVQVFGREHLPVDRPVILMANHQSYVDIPTLYWLKWPFRWMADAGLFGIPFFGWSMAMAGYIPVHRGNAKAAVRTLEQARNTLAQGTSIFIFPEGTRSHTGVLGRFQTGGFRLAIMTQRPIVPVVVVGTRYLLPRGSWIFRWGVRLQIHLLPPVQPVGDDLRQLRPLVAQVRHQMMETYRRQLPAAMSSSRNREPAPDLIGGSKRDSGFCGNDG